MTRSISFTLTSLSSTPKLYPSPSSRPYFPNSKTLNIVSFKPHRKSPLTHVSYRNPNRPRMSTIRSLFTGIVEEMGEVKHLGSTKDGGFDLKIRARTILEDVNLGDSIAVNGTCLTVTEFTRDEFVVGLSPETLRKTSLAELGPGSMVNLERAVKPQTRMGGHFVQGHVDGTGMIVSKDEEEDSLWVKVKAERGILRYIVPKGFIAVDGTSLTVVDVFDDESCFNFMLVSYTQGKVVIPLKGVGEKVNLEVDILGKYVERLLSTGFVDSIKAASSSSLWS